MRLPFFRRQNPDDSRARPQHGGVGAEAGVGAVQAARTRARRRLIGALVLLVAGVVGFPILFETQPRPLPVDTPILVPDRTPTRAASGPAARPLLVVPADAGNEPVATAAATATVAPAAWPPLVTAPKPAPAAASAASTAAAGLAPTPASAPAPVLAVAPAVTAKAQPVPQPVPMPVPKRETETEPETAKPAATTPPKPAPDSAASASGRFVVQVGAYNDPERLRAARQKVEKLGLKTSTQDVDSPTGKRTRVRVGPFANRQEADAAASKVKGSGLPANILAL